MNHDLIAGTELLAKGRLVRLATRPGDRIECWSGCLWLTQDGDLRDVILEAGEGFVADRPGGAIVHALRDARYLLLSPS